MTRSQSEATQVLVVGAGPVGLFAGLCAVRRGLRVTLIDQSWRGQAPGHATLLHPGSLRLLDELGVAARLLEAGQKLDRVNVHIGGARVAELELASPALAVSQRVLEETLLRELRAANVELMAPVQATTVEQGGDLVHVRVVRRELAPGADVHSPEWEPVSSLMLNADYVVGADGYESRIRTALGIGMIEVSPVESYAMFEFSAEPPSKAAIELAFRDDLGACIVPLGGGRVRAGFQLAGDLDQPPTVERLRGLAAERTPWLGAPPAIDWGVVTHFERRLARAFGKKKVWLAGDSAHITAPFGAQSMNVGLAEAHTLVQRIADRLAGHRADDIFAQYEAQRQREWHKLLGVNVHLDLLPHAPPWLSSHARRLVASLPASGRDLEHLLRQLGLVIR